MDPRRGLDATGELDSAEDQGVEEHAQHPRATRAMWAVAAVVITGLLGGVFVCGPAVRAASEHTDPTVALSSQPKRGDTVGRNHARLPLLTGNDDVEETSAVAAPSGPNAPASPNASASASPEPAATPTVSPSATPKPSPSSGTSSTPIPELGEIVGSQWTTASVNVRSGPGVEFPTITSLKQGHEVRITNVVVDNRWQQVQLDGEPGFISNKFLADEADLPKQTESPKQEGDIATEQCPAAASVEPGLTPRAVDVLRAVCNEFPNVTGYGGWREGTGSDHNSGRAIDVMISGEAGWEVAHWARSNAARLGITEVIYAQKIWTSQRSGDGWRSMADRGSDTANHYDHVHIGVK